MLYCYETCVVNNAERKFLENFEMWCWIGMLRASWTEHRINESILSVIHEYRVTLKTIRTRRWNTIGHIQRLVDKLIYRILEGKIDGNKD